MYSTENQRQLKAELDVLYADQGAAFTAGYMSTMLQDMLNLLPKRKQAEFIKQVSTFNGRQLVKVKNLLTGAEVEIRRSERGSCTDPSMERYFSM